MTNKTTKGGRCILAAFAHPDDETSACGGTFTKYAKEGVEVQVITATRGELGALGTGGLSIQRDELPAVRESELRDVMKLYGANPPILLGYRDQELAKANEDEAVNAIVKVIEDKKPDVVITFGPTGISSHEDHIAIHKLGTKAFQKYLQTSAEQPRLYYVALPKGIAEQYELKLHESEMDISVGIDISDYKARKIEGLRTYRSQQDAQELADMFEQNPINFETFHQAYPPIESGKVVDGFW